MKKIFLLLTALPLLFTSCTKDEENLFSDSPADRKEKRLTENKSVLTGAPNGWLMSYYPSPTQEYGGYTLLVKFCSGDSVIVASELERIDSTVTSMYELTSDKGPVLTFNTYNYYMHYFSEPRNRDGIGPDDSGMRGDYEFVILEATPDSVILKGKKTGNKMRLTPIAPDANWADVLKQYADAAAKMYRYKHFTYTTNSLQATANARYRSLALSYQGEGYTLTTETVGYRYTLSGIEFYEPLKIGNTTVSAMNFTDDETAPYFIDAAGSGAKLTVVIPPLNQQFIDENWYFAYSGLGPWTLPYWNYVKNIYATSPNVEGEEIIYAYMGYSGSNYGFCFNSSGYTGALLYNAEPIGTDKISLKFAMQGAEYGAWYYNYAGYNRLLYPLGLSEKRTFTLTADNLKTPAWILLTEDDNPDNYMKLYYSQVLYPYRK